MQTFEGQRQPNTVDTSSRPRKSRRSGLMKRAAVLALVGAISAPAAATASTSKSGCPSPPRHEAPLKSDKGAILRLTRKICARRPVSVETRYDIKQTIASPTNPDAILSCTFVRALKEIVSGEPRYFAIEQTNYKKPSLRTLRVFPLGGVGDMEARVRSSRDSYNFPGISSVNTANTSNGPRVKVALDESGDAGTWARFKTDSSSTVSSAADNGRQFVGVAYATDCVPETPPAAPPPVIA